MQADQTSYPAPPRPPPLYAISGRSVATSRIHEFVMARDEAFSLGEYLVIKQELGDALSRVGGIASFTVARPPAVGRVLVTMVPGNSLRTRGKTFVAQTIQWATELPVRVKRHDNRFIVDGVVVTAEGWRVNGAEEKPRTSGTKW
ncbi:uncharacterized protein LOC62_06G007865 [Vanrija pseudolonga]|uniref:Uncharacterized protein n=1 Tax=Vanrija pseudolonga TaxID=143232 RepID=A0AAF1BNF0_9TREE|nr:hypothetical protein LOC62_06G007865 [Vanrija pseudolonga]